MARSEVYEVPEQSGVSLLTTSTATTTFFRLYIKYIIDIIILEGKQMPMLSVNFRLPSQSLLIHQHR